MRSPNVLRTAGIPALSGAVVKRMTYRADRSRARRIQQSDWTRYVTRALLGREFRQVPKLDSLADLPHDVKVKVDIVVGGEDGAGDFSRSEEVTKIGARVAAADGTTTPGINGLLVLGVTRVLDEYSAFAGVEASVTRVASGEHAIHHVNPEGDVVGDLLGAADAHEIAQAILGQQSRCFGGHFTSDFVRLADSESTNGVARKIEIDKLARTFAAQIGKGRPLHDAKLPLAEIAVAARAFLKIDTRAPRPEIGRASCRERV